ncbi:MAG TPA: choice-of-anchor P family protein [Bryobacteraceae bacterium]|nr:choice-of-anchor P family protein [Bryobacteraceae bacterium]
MGEAYRYHASTTGVWGHITEPFNEIIPVQASLSLPGTGGFATARVERFDFHGIVQFESLEALVSGSRGKGSYDSTATVTITGLNILNLVTADRVVARIAAENPEDRNKPPFITPLGSYFQNLRIAGCPVDLKLDTGKFHGLDTDRSTDEARQKNKSLQQAFAGLAEGRAHVKDYLRKCFGWLEAEAEQPRGVTTCSLVSRIEESEKLPEEMRPIGHVIPVRGFGFIRLAEFRITDTTRTITMLQVDLGSSPSGSTSTGGASGGGSDG